MKTLKRIYTMLLAVAMSVMSVGAMTAFAAENVDSANVTIASENADTGIAPASTNHFIRTDNRSFSSSAVGGSFTCLSGVIKFSGTFTPSNGSTILAVRLHNLSTGQLVREWQSSNGRIGDTISVPAGMVYQFEYLRAYGTQQVSVSNKIYQVE